MDRQWVCGWEQRWVSEMGDEMERLMEIERVRQ